METKSENTDSGVKTYSVTINDKFCSETATYRFYEGVYMGYSVEIEE